jgi:hypothetical protein
MELFTVNPLLILLIAIIHILKLMYFTIRMTTGNGEIDYESHIQRDPDLSNLEISTISLEITKLYDTNDLFKRNLNVIELFLENLVI